jgi:hypothetical protein
MYVWCPRLSKLDFGFLGRSWVEQLAVTKAITTTIIKIKKCFILCLGGTSPQARDNKVADRMRLLKRAPVQTVEESRFGRNSGGLG